MNVYKEKILSNYLMHYGIKQKSGRYKYGSGNRPYQHEGFDPYKAMNNIDRSLSKKERSYLESGSKEHNVPVEKFFFDKNLSAYLMTVDYLGKYKDEHPVEGKVIGIAAKKESRGKGITDDLVKKAQKYYVNDTLVAEINKDNSASRKLFERNGFTKVLDDGNIDYYTWKKKG